MRPCLSLACFSPGDPRVADPEVPPHRAGIAFTAKMMNPRPTFDGKFSYQKIYQELDYLAGGILTIPPNGEKALKPSKDNSYVRQRCPGLAEAEASQCADLSRASSDFLLHPGRRVGYRAPHRLLHRPVRVPTRRRCFPLSASRADTRLGHAEAAPFSSRAAISTKFRRRRTAKCASSSRRADASSSTRTARRATTPRRTVSATCTSNSSPRSKRNRRRTRRGMRGSDAAGVTARARDVPGESCSSFSLSSIPSYSSFHRQ